MSKSWNTLCYACFIFLLAGFVLPISFSDLVSAQGQSRPFTISSTIDGKTYSITGEAIGNSTAMPESFIINPGNSLDIVVNGRGELRMTLPKTLIEGILVVTAGNEQIYHNVLDSNSTSTSISISIPKDVGSIKILASRVVPELPIPVIGAIAGVIGLIAILGRTRILKPF